MSTEPAGQSATRIASRQRTASARGAIYFVLWLVLMPSLKLTDLVFGVLAAGGATWVSMSLLPPETGRLRFSALLALLPHFLWESVRAGIDVARRALDPKLPLNPGFVTCPMGFPPGLARNRYATITSLLPGSVPVGDGADALVYHCLDISQPVVEQLCEEERLLSGALVVGRGHV
jgi:multicomponent Na+:H+ antiporter subunit E